MRGPTLADPWEWINLEEKVVIHVINVFYIEVLRSKLPEPIGFFFVELNLGADLSHTIN